MRWKTAIWIGAISSTPKSKNRHFAPPFRYGMGDFAFRGVMGRSPRRRSRRCGTAGRGSGVGDGDDGDLVAGDRSAFMVDEFVKDVEAGHVEQFMNRLTAFFADNSYQVAGEAELYFQNALYLIFKIMGFHTQVEIPTSDGRMDVLIQTSDYIYIIECKLDGSAEEALQQIEVKNYAAPFAMDKRTVVRLGINFSSKTRGVESWKQR